MLDHMIKIAKHIRPELVCKWIAAGAAGMLCAVIYDYATKGDDIFFEDGEYDWVVDGATEETSSQVEENPSGQTVTYF